MHLLVQGALSFHAAPGGRTRRVATTTERRGKDAALPRKLIEGPLHGKRAAMGRVSARGDPSGRRGHDLISGVRFTRRFTFERKEAFGTASTLRPHISVIHLKIKRSRGAK